MTPERVFSLALQTWGLEALCRANAVAHFAARVRPVETATLRDLRNLARMGDDLLLPTRLEQLLLLQLFISLFDEFLLFEVVGVLTLPDDFLEPTLLLR